LRRTPEVLPGAEAHRLLAPSPRRGWSPDHPPEDSRPAAALVLLYPREGRPHLALTVRSEVLSRHGGQVSLPGGATELGEGLVEAALREATEEIGIDASSVRIVAALTPLHIPVSAFIVHPIVGVADRTPTFRLAAHEVERVLEVPFDALTDPARLHVTTRMHADFLVEVPYFELGGEKVWGATAMILAELLCAVGECPDITHANRDEG
jgi:8-oxo-dGTP pyrophosphatase MutT (NUDIX family)